MLALFVIVVSLSGVFGQAEFIMAESIDRALRESFYKSESFLSITIQTDFDENKLLFLDMLDEILKKQSSLRVQLDVNNEFSQSVSDNNLWFIDSYEAFRRLYRLLHEHRGDSPGFYLIVLRSSVTYNKSFGIMQKIFSDMFFLMTANVDILIESSNEEVLFYTFFPYQETACRSTAPVSFNRFANGTLSNRLIFPPKTRAFHGCPIRVTAKTSVSFLQTNELENGLQLSGLEGELLNELAVRMNCTWEFIEPNEEWGRVLFNLTIKGPFIMLNEGQTDILVGAYFHDPYQNLLFTPSITYFYTSIVIAVRRPASELPKLTWLLAAFDEKTRVYTLILLVTSAACITLARWEPHLKKLFRLQPNHSTFLHILATAFGMPVKYLPTKNMLRLSFVIWSLGVLIIRAAYQGKLFDSYRRVSVVPAPSTVLELLNEHYTIHSRFVYSPIINQMSGIGNVNYKNLKNYEDLMNSSEKNAVIGSKALIMTVLTAKDMQDLVTEPLLSQYACMFFQQHSVLAPRVNEIILRIQEAGVLKHWMAQYHYLKDGRIKPLVTYVPGPITIGRFKYILLSFAALYVPAGVVFVVELAWARMRMA